MRVLLTGAAGYAGRGIGGVLKSAHWVRSLDIRDAGDAAHESVVGDLADLAVCRTALDGIDAMVLCHMAPNPSGYATPQLAMDVNVKGTTNLYHAAVELGIARAVLISSEGVLRKVPNADAVPGDGPYCYNYHSDLYVLTKICQEVIARAYCEGHGVITSILRPAWIVYDGECVTKYGSRMERYDTGLIDPRDIGAAVAAALALPNPALEAFNIGQDDCHMNLTAARKRLGWNPQFHFTGLPR